MNRFHFRRLFAASYFEDCPRDEHGWCSPGGGEGKEAPTIERGDFSFDPTEVAKLSHDDLGRFIDKASSALERAAHGSRDERKFSRMVDTLIEERGRRIDRAAREALRAIK